MHRPFLRTAVLLGALTVALGAFGAHALKDSVSEAAVKTFETGVRYQFYHLLALMALAIIYNEFTNKWIVWAGNLFLTGIALFSGSLYVLTLLLALGKTEYNWIGAITPFGGLAFIAGWFCFFTGLSKSSNT